LLRKSLDSFLDFFAAFFSFGVMAGFFLSSLWLLRSFVMVSAPDNEWVIFRPTTTRPGRLSRVDDVLTRFCSVLNAERRLLILNGPGSTGYLQRETARQAWNMRNFSTQSQ